MSPERIRNTRFCFDITQFDESYVSMSFRYNRSPSNMLFALNGMVLWIGVNEMLKVEHIVVKGKADNHSLFGLHAKEMKANESGAWLMDILPWPAFMALALLHCHNVVAEDVRPDEQTQRRVAKSGNPPRCTYKTLKLQIPQASRRHSSGESGSEPATRFHLCRGHFKNLQHERFKSKGWHWWPAHWRGSPELGEVIKDYKLDSGEERQSDSTD